MQNSRIQATLLFENYIQSVHIYIGNLEANDHAKRPETFGLQVSDMQRYPSTFRKQRDHTLLEPRQAGTLTIMLFPRVG